MRNSFRFIAALSLVLAAAACSASPDQPVERPPLEGAAIGGPFTLTSEDGKTVRWQDFEGDYRIVYFGYTFCPDACPMDVQAMMAGFRRFEDAHPDLAAKVQPIFISIDPERDTPDALTQFTDAFHPRLLGLTGTQEQIDQAAKAFVAAHSKGEETAGGYLMDHTRIAYLMGPSGEPIAMLPVDEKPAEKAVEDVSAQLAKWVT